MASVIKIPASLISDEQKGKIVRVYLPPDANTLLSVANHCLRSRNYVNVIVAGKQPCTAVLGHGAAIKHCSVGIGIWTGRAMTRARNRTR